MEKITDRNLVHLLELTADLAGDKLFLTQAERSLTFYEACQAVRKSAMLLMQSGLPRGSRIAIYLPKQIEAVISFFGILNAGYIAVPINPVLKKLQVEHILQDSGAAGLITNTSRLNSLSNLRNACIDLEHVFSIDDPGSIKDWALHIPQDQPYTELPLSSLEHDPAAILYTSGSTGRPKGVVLSHSNLYLGAQSVAGYLNLSQTDKLLAVLPLSFDAGLSQVTTALHSGCNVTLLDYLLPSEVPRIIEQFGITAITGVPPFWLQMTGLKWEKYNTRTVRLFANTGGKMPAATLSRLREIFPTAKPYLMYGLTEAFRSTFLDPALVEQHPNSIGKAIPFARVGVFHADGRECDVNEVGELVHDGPLVSLGYWNNPEETAKRFRHSPFGHSEAILSPYAVWSGDKAYRDEKNLLYFVARADEMIKTSGYRVSPTELEEFVYSTRLADEVIAFGVSHPKLGSAIVLALGGDEANEAQLMHHIKRDLPTYMVPSLLIWEEALLRTPNGKIDRKTIAEKYSNYFITSSDPG